MESQGIQMEDGKGLGLRGRQGNLKKMENELNVWGTLKKRRT